MKEKGKKEKGRKKKAENIKLMRGKRKAPLPGPLFLFFWKGVQVDCQDRSETLPR